MVAERRATAQEEPSHAAQHPSSMLSLLSKTLSMKAMQRRFALAPQCRGGPAPLSPI
jgi:hypothetical protein